MPGRLQMRFLLMCVIWGTTWIAAKAGITAAPPVVFVATRFIAAGLLMLAIAWRTIVPFARADLPRVAAVILLMVALPYALLFWGAQFVSSGLTAILDLAFMPVALLGIGALLGEERFTRLRACGVVIGVIGLCFLFGPRAFTGTHDDGTTAALWGGAAIIVSALIYAVGSLLARPLLRRYPAAQISAITMLAGGIVLFAAALAAEPGAIQALNGQWGAAAWAGWLFLVLFGSLVGYTIYLELVHAWGAARAGSYAFVSPAIAAVLGMLVYHEAVGPLEALGMATMLAGAWLTVRPVPPAALPAGHPA